MHKNATFNIVQAAGNGNPLFNVIDGQRTDSGHMAHGAKLLSGPAMPRAEAIALADQLQALDDTYKADILAGCALTIPEERRDACDRAHLRYMAACEALGVTLPE